MQESHAGNPCLAFQRGATRQIRRTMPRLRSDTASKAVAAAMPTCPCKQEANSERLKLGVAWPRRAGCRSHHAQQRAWDYCNSTRRARPSARESPGACVFVVLCWLSHRGVHTWRSRAGARSGGRSVPSADRGLHYSVHGALGCLSRSGEGFLWGRPIDAAAGDGNFMPASPDSVGSALVCSRAFCEGCVMHKFAYETGTLIRHCATNSV